MSSDTTVDWGRDFEHNWGEGDNRYFRKFWRNVVRWLAENSEASQQRLSGRNRQGHLPPGAGDSDHRQGVRRTDSTRPTATDWSPAFAARTTPESRPFDETANALDAAAERPELPRQSAGPAAG